MPQKTIKRGEIVKLAGLVARVTFFDPNTGYLRVEHNSTWKATGYTKDLQVPTAEELKTYGI